jgi:hypothetical protein
MQALRLQSGLECALTALRLPERPWIVNQTGFRQRINYAWLSNLFPESRGIGWGDVGHQNQQIQKDIMDTMEDMIKALRKT